ncbi:hypothetical protein [Gordonia amicalis]|uniref:Uncharacterized protein n=1 Tax=Gordonia amicalis TaxID=89053 RepID=A0ABU4DL34_9ACTN|nr:hypothetical protein [Gordonia amicalis]MDV6309994.1 hypothetical protein [Gordonia amicalis]
MSTERTDRDDHESDFYAYPDLTRSPDERLTWRGRIAVGAAVVVLGGLLVATTVGLAHADETTTPSTNASSSTAADVSTVIAESSTDKIGLVSITHVDATDALVPNAVIHIERRDDTAAPSPQASSSTEQTPSTDASTSVQLPPPTDGGEKDTTLAFPVGASLDVLTGTAPIALALPEGVYTLTHLGTAGTDEAGPSASALTLRVTAGGHVNGALRQQPTTSSTSATPDPGN